jgi:WD40 repeat protein
MTGLPFNEGSFKIYTETKKELILYNYKTKNILSTSINKNLYPSPICLHPTKKQICSQSDDTIYLYDYDPEENNYKRTAPLKKCDEIDHPSIKYSPNGSLIALGDENNIEIINILFNYNIPSITYTVKNTEDNFYHTIQFHPNNAILAAVLTTQSDFIKLHYLESNKEHIFAESRLSIPNNSYYERQRNEAISFSPNGKYIMIQFNNQCVILSVPTTVIYHPKGSHSKTFLAYCLLKELNVYHNNLLPYDVIQLITNTLFEAFNYS